MTAASLPDNETERLAELHRLGILDTDSEQGYEDLVRIASAICGTPMGMVSFVDRERQWFKARLGIEASETPRDVAFCAHAIRTPDELFVVPDAQTDTRFVDNPLVTGAPNIRFYAGAPLVTPSGSALGTLCVVDSVPRTLEPHQREALACLSRQAVALIQLRVAYRELSHHLQERDWYEIQLKAYQRDLENENFQLQRQSSTDALTGLANRRALNEALEWRIERAREGERLHFAIVDIDHFKLINDLHGHKTGDDVLAEVATLLRTQVGGRGLVSRAGGEEFALVLADMSADTAERECEGIRDSIERTVASVPVTASIGLASYRRDDSATTLYVRADQALYEAKRSGRNRVVRSA